MAAGKTTAIGIILVAVIGLGVVGVLINLSFSNPLQIPPPGEPPGDEMEPIVKDELQAWAEAVYWQDFMPMVPAEGPPFYTVIRINVTNTGITTVTNFHAVRVTIYFHNSSLPLVTLDITSTIQYLIWPEVKPGASVEFEYTNVRDSIFSPTIEEGAVLYSRVLTRWENGSEMVLTTPPSELGYTH
jgi:hypothetical protein